MVPLFFRFSQLQFGCTWDLQQHTSSCYKPPGIVLSSVLWLCYHKGPRSQSKGTPRALRGRRKKTTHRLSILLALPLVPPTPAEYKDPTPRLPVPGLPRSCWLSCLPKGQPLHLNPTLAPGWLLEQTSSSGWGSGPSASSPSRRDLSKVKVLSEGKPWDFFQWIPHDGSIAPEILPNTAPMPSSPARRVWKNCDQETQAGRNMAALLLAQFEETCSHYCDFAFGLHLQSNWGLNLHSPQATFRFKNSISTYLVFAVLLFLHSALYLKCFVTKLSWDIERQTSGIQA